MVGTGGTHTESSAKPTKKKPSAKNAKDSSSGESKPATASSSSKTRDLTRSSSSVGKRIRVYRNGDVFFKGLKVVINTRQINSVQAFLDVINDRIGLTYGAKRLYTLNGHLVKTMAEIENDKEYVAASSAFTQLNYGHARTSMPTTDTAKHHTDPAHSTKQPLRISRSNEPRKERVESTTRRSGSVAPPARRTAANAQQNGGSTTTTHKKLVKRRSMPKAADHKAETSTKAAPSGTETSTASTTVKKKKKLVKKKVKVPEEEKKTSPRADSVSPASTITRAHSIIEHISVAERVSTPIPVKKEPDSEEENHDSVPSSTVGSPEQAKQLHENEENDQQQDKSPSPNQKSTEANPEAPEAVSVPEGDSNPVDQKDEPKEDSGKVEEPSGDSEKVEDPSGDSEKVQEPGEDSEKVKEDSQKIEEDSQKVEELGEESADVAKPSTAEETKPETAEAQEQSENEDGGTQEDEKQPEENQTEQEAK